MPELVQSTPIVLPTDPQAAVEYLNTLLTNIFSAVFNLQEGFFYIRKEAPERAREGTIAFADGTNWDPGSGRGIYVYIGTSWEPLAVARGSWQALTLLNSWVNYGGGYAPAHCWKDAQGIVHLEGTIKDGTITDGIQVFTLPVGYRPAGNLAIPALAYLKDGWELTVKTCQLNLMTSGAGHLYWVGSNNFLHFSGSFPSW